jgi:1-deoxy-D-xylulose 5-phosphate reductoisomerase
MNIPKAQDIPKMKPFKLSKCMKSSPNTLNLASGTITIILEYVSEKRSTIIKGIFTKKGFFQGLPIVKAIKQKTLMKLANRNSIFVSGVINKNISSTRKSYLFTLIPPILS